MGFSKEQINSQHPEALMIEAMKINKIPDGKENLLEGICSGGEYFGQLKKDGYFYEFEKTPNYAYLFSRNISKDTGLLTEKSANVPHIMKALESLPPRTILVGEIYYPGKTSKDVTKIMGCLPDKAQLRQAEDPIHFYIHDIIYYNNCDLQKVGAKLRYEILEKVYNKYNLDKHPFLELAKMETEGLFEKIAKALNDGEEGMVLKRKNDEYFPGKKPAWVTLKIKQVDYADVVITGACEPTKEYSGKEIETWQYWINKETGVKTQGLLFGNNEYSPITKPYFYDWKTSIEISAYNADGQLVKIGTVASGLTDEMQRELAQEPNKYIGEVCMVQCMSKDSKEKTIRHGFFKGMRDDKSAAECLISEIF